MRSPILFLIFNRPDLTARVFSRIREVRPARLYIAADGARESKLGEAEICIETRKVVENIDWPCDVKHLYRAENLGCKLAVSSAISWFFKHEETGIILEDDCYPDLTFFPFMAELLERYQDDESVGVIGGTNFQSPTWRQTVKTSYYFSRYPHIWGWGSWRRVWKDYDVDIKDWSKEISNERFPKRAVRKHISRWFELIRLGELDTWDYQLFHLLLRRKYLAICPTTNLVENIGFDGRATHTTKRDRKLPKCGHVEFPLVHPDEIIIDTIADRYTERHVYHISANWLDDVFCRIVRHLKNLLS